MKNLVISALSMFLFAGLISASSGHSYRETYHYDYPDTIYVIDTIEIVEDEDWVLCDTIAEEDYSFPIGIIADSLDSSDGINESWSSVMGESSSFLFAGETFRITDDSGSVFEYKVNQDGVSVTLTKGHANGVKTLVIPPLVEALDSYFFVTEIGNFAFMSSEWITGMGSPMKGVEHLVISEGIVSAGQNTFDHSPDLMIVDIPSSLEILPYSMFFDCKELREIRIPENSNIRKIESFVFAGCTNLESFTIPKEVTVIEDGPWRGCTSLQKLTLQEGNYDFIVEDGVLYSDWQGDLLQYPAGKKDKDYYILYGTEAICNSAFYENPYLETVSIPASVDSISHIAFFDCKSLRDVKFNNVIPFIGNKAFAECPNLKEITLYGSPEYTNEPGDSYNTFSEWTAVTIADVVPPVDLEKSSTDILSSAWNHIFEMPYFEIVGIDNNEDYGFPEYLGNGKAAVCGNAGPKPDVLHVLEAIPASYLVSENIDERNRITRFYVDKTDRKNIRVLYFFGGVGGNDLVVALFTGGDLKRIEKMIDENYSKHTR